MIDLDRLFPQRDTFPLTSVNAEKANCPKCPDSDPPDGTAAEDSLTLQNNYLDALSQASQSVPTKKDMMGRKEGDDTSRHTSAGGVAPVEDDRAVTAGTGVACANCRYLDMRSEFVPGSRRRFWWCCEKRHAMLEVWGGPRHELVAPESCTDFNEWSPPVWRSQRRDVGE